MAATMRQPVRWVRENIFVTRDGQPYAIWNLSGKAYGMSTTDQKERVRVLHQNLFRSLIGESTILGLVTAASPQLVMEKMLQDVPAPSEQWLRECNLTYQELNETPVGERVYFLVVPLGRKNPKELWDTFSRQFDDQLNQVLSMTVRPPADDVFKTWKVRAASVERNIPADFKPRPVGINALAWCAHHLSTRGAADSVPFTVQQVTDHQGWANAATILPAPLVDEGGLNELNEDRLPHLKLFNRRFVKVDTYQGPSSYQQFAVLGLTPQAGFVFPGGEFIQAAAGIPHDIDFVLRMTNTPAAKVKARNRRAEHNIKDQMIHRASQDGSLTGSNDDVARSAQELSELAAELSATDREVEVAASVTFCASGPDAHTVQDQMKDLRDFYASDEWILDVPLGTQEQLFWDFWPGTKASASSREARQITTGRFFSMGIALTNDSLGMPHGFRLGTNITTGRRSPVLMSLGGLAENDISGSMGYLGELGSGKSVAMKTVASHSIDRGAQLIAVDHSDNQEWAALGRSLTTANVIDFMNPEWSLDPLRIYTDSGRRIRQTLNLLTMMLDVNSTSTEGLVLNDELKKIASGDLELNSLRQLKDHLASDAIDARDQDAARQISRLMEVFSDLDFSGAFFNSDLEPMDFSAQATIFCTHGMSLPTAHELHDAQARSTMSTDKKVGRATYAFLAAVGANIMYDDDSQETLFIVDECHHMTGSPEGEETISTAIKTGRKHKGAVLLGTHAAEELGSEKLRALIPQRLVFRTRDDALARQNLMWLDESYAHPEYVELLTEDISPIDVATGEVPEHRRGEAIFRDHANRVGLIKVAIPRSPERAKTVLTTPPKVREEK